MPAALIAEASVLGFVFGFLQIAWIVIASIFLYHIAVETGQFQVMKESIAALSSDKRIQVILIAFCFGAFLEGTGGGGAPVAIAGSFLIGLGFPPFRGGDGLPAGQHGAGGVGRRGQSGAGAVGQVTGLPEQALNAMIGRILPPFSLILPLWLVRSMVSWRAHVGGACRRLLVSGAAFAGMQFFWSNFGKQPGGHRRRHLLAAGDGGVSQVLEAAQPDERQRAAQADRPAAAPLAASAVLKGWSPFILSLGLHLRLRPARGQRAHLNVGALKLPMPGLHEAVVRVPPVVPQPDAGGGDRWT